jgi:NADH-quinone oxidoreductase subunit F
MLARIVDGNCAMRDVDLVGDLAKNMLGRTFCPLGDAAAMPTISIVEKFRPEFEAYVAKNPFASSELVQVA